MLEDYRKKGLSVTAKVLLSALGSGSLVGATILELGCGFGALTLALLRGGAVSAVGIDLSPKMIDTARSLVSEAGLSGSAIFELGDGAKANLVTADIVVLDSVFCCYPDVAGLLDNSSSAAGRYYAISIPDDRRPMTRLLKVLLPLQGVVFRRGAFRFFVHQTKSIIRMLESKGFKVVFDGAAGHLWSVIVFSAPSSG